MCFFCQVRHLRGRGHFPPKKAIRPCVKIQIVPPVNINQSPLKWVLKWVVHLNIGPKMGGDFTQPKWDPKTVLTTTAECQPGPTAARRQAGRRPAPAAVAPARSSWPRPAAEPPTLAAGRRKAAPRGQKGAMAFGALGGRVGN